MLDTNVVSTPNVLKLNGYPIILQRKMITGRWGRQTKSALKQDFFLLKMGFKCIFLKPLLQSFIPLFIPLQCQ